jgi:hypothetical protein
MRGQHSGSVIVSGASFVETVPSPRWPTLRPVVAMFRKMLEEDRRRAGWSVGQAAWRLGISVREDREIVPARRWHIGRRGTGSAGYTVGRRCPLRLSK